MQPKSKSVSGVHDGFNFDAHYRYGRLAVAWRVWGWSQVWEPMRVFVEDEDGAEYETDDPGGEGEWIDDPDRTRVLVCMVGDDRYETADRDDLTLIDDLDYCVECGQIGCQHDGRERA